MHHLKHVDLKIETIRGSSNIVRLIYKRDHLKRKAVKYKSDVLWESCIHIRNSVTELIRSSKKNTMKIALKKTIPIPKVCERCLRN